MHRPCLAGLQKELRLRLHAEPCQTVLQTCFGSGSGAEAPGNPVTGAGGRMRSHKFVAPRGSIISSVAPATFAPLSHPFPRARCASSRRPGRNRAGQEPVARQGGARVRAAPPREGEEEATGGESARWRQRPLETRTVRWRQLTAGGGVGSQRCEQAASTGCSDPSRSWGRRRQPHRQQQQHLPSGGSVGAASSNSTPRPVVEGSEAAHRSAATQQQCGTRGLIG
ncbi:hypothetical protein PVAP13_8KG372800 [Panicum virgatum]|uniref:Uncharacterized protein n=1 Tax=Panicum virgatum TaxID=38727 RepID=A0A8T0PYB2_PANVG|nr:hypothetical protein PVAP13_8KG372800 [Panicum virgatum]